MKNNKKFLIVLSLVILLSGCSNKSNDVNSTSVKTKEVTNNNVSNNDTNQIEYTPDKLQLLNIVLPQSWKLDQYKFTDEKGENRGEVSAINYMDNFDVLTVKPNHSSVTKDEYIDVQLGKCRLVTLDMDNGTAASGVTGTHDTYYASLPIKGKVIYIFSFTKNDKNPDTKNQFIEILKSLTLK